MYIPAHFVNRDDQEILNFIRSNSFGILVSHNANILATHIPLELSGDGKILSGHLSKANPQAKALKDEQEVLCIFNGPHTYISSSWYDHENVPTWNYIAVQVRGKVSLINGEVLYNRLVELVDKFEAASVNPVTVQGMSADYLDRHIKAIVGFDIEIQAIEAAYKLSQNRDKLNHSNIVSELEKRKDHNSWSVAEEMKKHTPKP